MDMFPRHDMADMESDSSNSSSSSSHGSSSMMTMVFQTSHDTPLYASSWTPSSEGAYAGTCVFLVILAVVGRCLLAFKAVQEARWIDQEAKRRYVAVNGKVPFAEQISVDPGASQMTLSSNGVEESVMVVERKRGIARPWRFSVEPVRALLDTLVVGIGYLLMLAVMTMNVGYFLSVLAGVFIGSLAVGRYSQSVEH